MNKPKTITFRPSKGNETLIPDLEELAKQDNRNLNNFIETVLLAYVRNNETKLRVLDKEKDSK